MPDEYDDEPEVAPDYAEDGFHSLDSARYGWLDAPEQDSILSDLLEVAKVQVLAFAPERPSTPGTLDGGDADTDFTVPTSYRVAQLMQTRNLWNASKVDPASGGMGEDSFVVRPFPMDWVVKNIIRPKRGKPVIG